ncbi:MAG: hypothetical protein ACQ9ET_00725 [Nitrosomonadaceae bacterium]
MSYAPKYRLQYTPLNGEKTYIDLKLEGYSGAVTDVKGGGNPLTMRMLQSGDPITEPIKATEAELTLMSQSNFQFQEIFTSTNAKMWRMDIYKGNKDLEPLINRDFQGGLYGWAVTSNFTWDKDTAKLTNQSGSQSLQAATTHNGNYGVYTISVYYADAVASETITINYNSLLVGSETLSTAVGVVSKNVTITSGNADQTLEIVKAGTSPSDIRIKAVVMSRTATPSYNIWWKGFVQPDVYSEPLLTPPYPTKITAICGLGKLKNVLFGALNTIDSVPSSRIISVIQDALDDTEIYLPIKSSINLYEANTMADGDDPLYKLFVNEEVFLNLDPDEDNNDKQTVLRKLLTPFFSRITQANGYWNIERVANKKDGRTGYEYDWLGYELDDSLAMNDTIELTAKSVATPYRFKDQSQYIEFERSWQNIPLKQYTGKRDSIIWGDFNEEFWDSSTALSFWTKLNAPSITRNENAIKFTGIPYNAFFDFNVLDTSEQQIYYNGGPVSGTSDFKGHKVTLTFEYRGYTTKTAGINVPVVFYYYDSSTGNRTYLQGDGSWDSAIDYLSGTISKADAPANTTDWKEYEVESVYTDKFGTNIRARIWQPFVTNSSGANPSGWTEVRNLRVKIEARDVEETIESNYEINADNWLKPDEIEVYFGDLIDGTGYTDGNKMRTYNGILHNGVTFLTAAKWDEWGGRASFDLIHERLRIDLFNQYRINRQLLKGTVYGPLEFNSVVKDTDNGNRYFIPISCEYNDRFSEYSGEWIELDDAGLKDETEFFDGAFFDNTFFDTV